MQTDKQVYTVAEVTALTGFSRHIITQLFEHEKGVLILARPEIMHKRSYRSIRIPRPVYERVIRRLVVHWPLSATGTLAHAWPADPLSSGLHIAASSQAMNGRAPFADGTRSRPFANSELRMCAGMSAGFALQLQSPTDCTGF
jgi:hypothetical protein